MMLKVVAATLLMASLISPSGAQICIENIEDIYTAEATIDDTTVRRTYTLCPRRIYEIGYLDLNFDLQGFNVQPPLPIRPNITIRCGETGERSNLCWMGEGDLHVDATPFRGISDATVEGVKLEGIVFIGARKYSTWATKPGDITFTDCEWRDHTKSIVPIMMDWFDGSDSLLSITFNGCNFNDNRYFGRGSHTSIIYANSKQNSLRIVETAFENNDMLHNNTLSMSSSSLIETLGPLTIERSCFTNNQVGVSSATVFGSPLTNENNYAFNTRGLLCPFASVFSTIQQLDSFEPICVEPREKHCLIDATSSPTVEPSQSPTASPSNTPTLRPTSIPTEKPSSIPTANLTESLQPTSPEPISKEATEEPSESPIEFVWPTNRPVNPTEVGPPDESTGFSLSINISLLGLALSLSDLIL